jgi:hypothetical protein
VGDIPKEFGIFPMCIVDISTLFFIPPKVILVEVVFCFTAIHVIPGVLAGSAARWEPLAVKKLGG